MEGNSTSSCNGFGDNSASCSPNPMMLMMMPLISTSTCHHPHPHPHVPHHPYPINPNIPNHPININNNNNLISPYYYNYNNHHLPIPTMPLSSSTNTISGLGPLFMDKNNHQHPTPSSSSSIKAKIMAHPHYHRLLSAYVNCQKVGAPPEAAARLEEAYAAATVVGGDGGGGGIGEDPALDQFMEAYCEMLTKYEQELSKPFKEAMHFLHSIESQFKSLTISSTSSSDFACAEATDRNGSSEEDADVANDVIDPSAEDRELKGQLLRRYSGYLGNLKQEFMKKRKKGKLPKEARQQLLDWWSRHYKWPYPSESQKVALAESTGLDQKQINNWFINQRKRHWKPSEDMQFMVMDPSLPHHYYMDPVLGNPYPMI